MNLRSAIIKVGIALLPISAGELCAQDQHPPNLMELGLDELLNVTVTTVSKKRQSVWEAPAAVTVITKEDIHRFGYRTLNEALRSVLGFYGSNDRNYEYLGVRGFARPGDYNQRVLLLVDGHKVNDPNYDYAPIGDDLGIDIGSLERIEVIKGASSAVWGTNGLLGVINLITKRGADVNGGSAAVQYGSHNRTKGAAEYGTKTEHGLEIYSYLSALESDGQRSIYFPELDQPENDNGVTTGNDGEGAYRGLLRGSYDGATLLVTHGWRRKEVPTAPYDTLFTPKGNRTWDYATRADLSYESSIGADGTDKLLARGFIDRTVYYANYLYPTDSSEGTSTNRDEGSSRLFGGELRYSGDVSDSLSFVAGSEIQRAYNLHFGYGERSPGNTTVLDINNDFNLYSGFSELTYRLPAGFQLIGGLRMDHYTEQGTHWSPRGGIVFHPEDSMSIKLLYGEAFRQPNSYERNYADGFLFQSNENLRPEELESYEFIIEKRFGSTTVTVDFFEFNLRRLVSQEAIEGGLIQYQNKGSIRSDGMEFSSVSRLDGGYLLRGGFSISHTINRYEEESPSNSPRYLGDLGLSIPFADELFRVSPELQFIGPRETLQDNRIGESLLTNCRVLSDTLLPHLTASITIYNLFDERSFTPSAEEHKQDRIPRDGRTWMAEIGGRF